MKAGDGHSRDICAEDILQNSWGFQDPDDVGASEYRAIYETLVEGLDSFEENENSDELKTHAISMLQEFVEHAQFLKHQLEATMSHVVHGYSSYNEFELGDYVSFLCQGERLFGTVARVYATRENYHVEVDGDRYFVNVSSDDMRPEKKP
jgi:hypothetical protein